MFDITKKTPLKEIGSTLVEATHRATGASIIHIQNDDRENFFSLCFQTYPENSTGIAHILEHTVLCGSKKFPVKDPFFGMIKRSLNTFLNAMTGADFTCYPGASCIEQDFYNLLEVYLDAVFHPLLSELSFRQEGHRLNYEKGKLQFEGIVFNEMKGVLSSPESRLYESISKYLLKDTPYHYNFGGDPKDIPHLSYEEFLNFHKKFYHPSQCLFFFYGNLPLEKHLEFIETHALKGVIKAPPIPSIPKQPRFHHPVKVTESYPFHGDNVSKQTLIAYAWLTAEASSLDDALALSLIDTILMETDASPLKEALLSSRLLSKAEGHLDTEMGEIPYALIIRGTEASAADQIEKLIFDTLKNLTSFEPHLVEGSIHQLEFSQKEISTHYGLNLSFRALASHFLKIPVKEGLSLEQRFQNLRQAVKDPHYLPSLIKKYLIDNPHFVRIVMEPNQQKEREEKEEEEQLLSSLQVNKEEIETLSQKLKAFQEREDDLSCLPKLHLKDVPQEVLSYPLVQHQVGDMIIFHHDCLTNGIIYAELVYDLPHLSKEELIPARLATSLWTSLGAKNRDYKANLDLINEKTGGIHASLGMFTQVDHEQEARPALILQGKALDHYGEDLFTLFKDFLNHPRFDEKERISQLIEQLQTDLKSHINRNPLSYASNLAMASYLPQQAINLAWYGLEYYQFIETLSKDKLPSFDIINKLLHKSKPHLILSCSNEQFETLKSHHFYDIGTLSSSPHSPWSFDYPPPSISSQARVISSGVAFTAESHQLITLTHPDAPALTLAMHLMETKVLHKRIREQGGAYGSGARYNPLLGTMHFFGYRDPHIKKTLHAFNEAIEAISSGQFDAEDLEGAKLKHIQDEETPIAPGARASTEYNYYRTKQTKDQRQAFRNSLLKITKEEIMKATKTHLLHKKGIQITFSGKELLDKEKIEFPRFSLDESI